MSGESMSEMYYKCIILASVSPCYLSQLGFFFIIIILFYCSEAYSVYVLVQEKHMCLWKLYHVSFPPVVLLLHRLMHVYTAMHSTPISVTTLTSVI